MKKGYTLMEIILCISLITIVGTLSFSFLKKNKNTGDQKLKELVINSASVKFLNKSENQQIIKDNYGYQVLSVQELIDEGYVSEETYNSLLNEAKSNNLTGDYSKILIRYLYNEEGSVDYTYPYLSNDNPFVFSGDEVYYFRNDSAVKYQCNYNIDELYYFNENYEKIYLKSDDKVQCKIYEDSNDYNDYIDVNEGLNKIIYKVITKDNSGNEKYYYSQEKVTSEDPQYRDVYVFSKNNLILKVDYNNQYFDSMSSINPWFKGSSLQVCPYFLDKDGNNNKISNNDFKYNWKINNSLSNDHSNCYLLEEGSNNYFLSIQVDDNNIIDLTEKTFVLDNNAPTFDYTYDTSNIRLNFNDNYSGVKKFTLDGVIYSCNNIDCKSFTKTLSNPTDYEGKELEVEDNAGNIANYNIGSVMGYNVVADQDNPLLFYVNVQNVKKVLITFDTLDLENNPSYCDYDEDEYKCNTRRNYDTSSFKENTKIEQNFDTPTNSSYSFSVYDLSYSFYNFYRHQFEWVGRGLFYRENVYYFCNIELTDVDGNTIKIRKKIKVNMRLSEITGFISNNHFYSVSYKPNSNNDFIYISREWAGHYTNYLLYLFDNNDNNDGSYNLKLIGNYDYGLHPISFKNNSINYYELYAMNSYCKKYEYNYSKDDTNSSTCNYDNISYNTLNNFEVIPSTNDELHRDITNEEYKYIDNWYDLYYDIGKVDNNTAEYFNFCDEYVCDRIYEKNGLKSLMLEGGKRKSSDKYRFMLYIKPLTISEALESDK